MSVSLAMKGATVVAGSVLASQGLSAAFGVKPPITPKLQAITAAIAFIATSIFWACKTFKSSSEEIFCGLFVCLVAKCATLMILDENGNRLPTKIAFTGVAQLLTTLFYNAIVQNS